MRINPYATYQTTTGTSNEVKKELGKDEFLKILAAQFRGQNPLDPVKDTEFIAQMAQFSSLEQLQNISAKLEVFEEDLVWSQYLSLLGKQLYALTTDEKFVEGIVTGINFRNGQFQFEIDGRDCEVAAIISVGVPPQPQAPDTSGANRQVTETEGTETAGNNSETGESGSGDGEAHE